MHKLVFLFSVALTFCAVGIGETRAQAPDAMPAGYDCVIEPRQVVELGSAEDGVVREILVDRGDIVEAGAIVAQLDFELQALTVERARVQAGRNVEIRASKSRLEYRRNEAARARQLHEKSIISTKIFDEANVERQLAEYGVAAAELDRWLAEVELRVAEAYLERRTIRSTVTGVVVEVMKSPGELTHDQAPVVTIAQIDPLAVEAYIPIERFGTVMEGMEADIILEGPIDGTYKARVEVVDRVLDTASGTFGVRLELPNPEYKLPAGLKCQVRFRVKKTLLEGGGSQDGNPAAVMPSPVGGQKDRTLTDPDGFGREDIAQTGPTNYTSNNKALIFVIQSQLAEVGYDPGQPDGILGDKTRSAIQIYQREAGMAVNGSPSLELFHVLRQATLSEHQEPS